MLSRVLVTAANRQGRARTIVMTLPAEEGAAPTYAAARKPRRRKQPGVRKTPKGGQRRRIASRRNESLIAQSRWPR